MDLDNDVKFVVRHYRKEAFSTDKGWRRLGIATQSWWRRGRVAAAVAAVIAVGATAAIYVSDRSVTKSAEVTVMEKTVGESTLSAVRAIDFDNAPLTAVAEEIQRVYGVEIENLPAGADDYRLTLHYEGNVKDLIGHINDILDTNLQLRE